MSFVSRIADWFAPVTPSPETRADSIERSVEKRVDGWFSSLSGYGVEGRDKRLSVRFQSDMLDDQTAMDLWRGDDIAARMVETIPNEALRQGWTLNVGDQELAEELMARSEELNAHATFLQAKKIERAVGGAAIFPVINDGQSDMRLPLNEERISKISHLQIFEPQELRPHVFYDDPLAPKFGEPKTYLLYPRMRQGAPRVSGGVEIHESRLIVFPGIRVSRTQVSANGHGDSVLSRGYRILRDFNVSWAATTALLHDFSQAIFKIKGLAELIAHDKDDVIKTRIQAVELARSTIRAVLMDATEEFERKQTPVAGLAELLAALATRLAAAADMPVTLLMGQSPSGLNATGESDIRFFYDRVESHRTLGLKPQISRFTYLLIRELQGPARGKEPDTWSVEFPPLWQPTAMEIAQTRKVIADTDNVYFSMGAVSAEEIALSRWSGDTYSSEMTIDFEGRAKLNAAGETAAEPAPTGPKEVAPLPGREGEENPDEDEEAPGQRRSGEGEEPDDEEVDDEDDEK